MSPHHFARLNKNKVQEDSQRELEEKVDQVVRGAVAIIAAPFHAMSGKKDSIDRDKP
jgi:hypothetical protein